MRKTPLFGAAIVAAAVLVPFVHGTPVQAEADIPITGQYFPDDNFRAVVSQKYDKNGNGVLEWSERKDIMNLKCENANIESIVGVEWFPNIQGLWCLNNKIKSMDLSKNTELVGIWCSNNQYTSLDFTGLDKLEWVYCFDCKLTSVNFRNNPKLAYLEVNSNPNLKELDLSQNTQLENLFCSSCGLTELDLSNNPMLCELDAFKNNLTSLDLSNNPKLKRLDIWDNNNLGNVDISKLKGLTFYNCAKNGVTKLDMSNQPDLQLLVCGYNKDLKYLNVSKCPRLADLRLDCDYQLTSLDLSNNHQLYNLYAFGMRDLASVNISNNPYLIKTYTEGKYRDEPQLGNVHSYSIEFGGSEEYFEDLTHCLVVDNGKKIVTTGGNPKVIPMCYIDTNDGFSGNETFATRGQAIQLLWEKAGKPKVSGSSRFDDIADNHPNKDAIRWGETYNICFGCSSICSDSFCPDELISREDFALMAHRLALYMKLGTAFDYGRTDWLKDFYDIEYYGWGAFTWAIQFEVLDKKAKDTMGYPHGRMTTSELKKGANKIFNLDGAASYSAEVNGNGGTPNANAKTIKYYSGLTGKTYPISSSNTKKPTATPTPVPRKDEEEATTPAKPGKATLTPAPTIKAGTTAAPTTKAGTTAAPTTKADTTAAPTTKAGKATPTTKAGTTATATPSPIPGKAPVGTKIKVGTATYSVSKSGEVTYTTSDSKTEVEVPATISDDSGVYKETSISDNAIQKTVTKIIIGKNVTVIADKAFYGCKDLETVKGGESVKAVGEQAFAKCPKLKTFKLSSKQLISIGANCFKGDKKLKSIVINKTKMLTKAGLKKSLAGSKIKTVKVAKKKVKAYKKIFTKKVCGKKVTVTK